MTQASPPEPSDRLDRIERILEQHNNFIGVLLQQQQATTQQIGQTMQSVDRLANAQLELAQAVDSIEAAVNRLDRLMDYVLRQQGSNDNPQQG